MGQQQTKPTLQLYKIVNLRKDGTAMLKHTQTGHQYLLRMFNSYSIQQITRYKKLLDKRKQWKSNQLLKIQQIHQHEQKHLCSILNNIYILLQFPFKNLCEQFKQRLKIKQSFSQDQILSILYSCCLGLQLLYSHNFSHECIRMQEIYIDKMGLIKISDPLVLGLQKNYSNLMKQPPEQQEKNHISPEIMNFLEDCNFYYYEKQKSDIFVLGSIILELALLRNIQLYDPINKQNYYDGINELLNEVKQKYSKHLSDILWTMLQKQPKNRLNFKMLAKKVQSISIIEQQQPTKRIQSFNCSPNRNVIDYTIKKLKKPQKQQQVQQLQNKIIFPIYDKISVNKSTNKKQQQLPRYPHPAEIQFISPQKIYRHLHNNYNKQLSTNYIIQSKQVSPIKYHQQQIKPKIIQSPKIQKQINHQIKPNIHNSNKVQKKQIRQNSAKKILHLAPNTTKNSAQKLKFQFSNTPTPTTTYNSTSRTPIVINRLVNDNKNIDAYFKQINIENTKINTQTPIKINIIRAKDTVINNDDKKYFANEKLKNQTLQNKLNKKQQTISPIFYQKVPTTPNIITQTKFQNYNYQLSHNSYSTTNKQYQNKKFNNISTNYNPTIFSNDLPHIKQILNSVNLSRYNNNSRKISLPQKGVSPSKVFTFSQLDNRQNNIIPQICYSRQLVRLVSSKHDSYMADIQKAQNLFDNKNDHYAQLTRRESQTLLQQHSPISNQRQSSDQSNLTPPLQIADEIDPQFPANLSNTYSKQLPRSKYNIYNNFIQQQSHESSDNNSKNILRSIQYQRKNKEFNSQKQYVEYDHDNKRYLMYDYGYRQVESPTLSEYGSFGSNQLRKKKSISNKIQLIPILQDKNNISSPQYRMKQRMDHNAQQEIYNNTPNQSDQENLQSQLIFCIEDFPGGGRYQGFKYNYQRHGQGRLYFNDGGYYEGQWLNNKMHGFGKLYYANGQIAYQGNWFKDQFQGKGRIFNDFPEQFNQNQEFDGQDFTKLSDKWVYYQGQFSNDRKNGKGTIRLTNGQIFEGDFVNDAIDGYGQFSKSDGTLLKGYWKQNIYFSDMEQKL